MVSGARLAAGCAVTCLLLSVLASEGAAQDAPQPPKNQMTSTDNKWMVMQDGIVFAEFDHQGGPRGGNEFVAPNWWMGMAGRDTPLGRLTFNAMFSLDPATVGQDGYGEIFQVGEALNGLPLIDNQHPHDLFMQLAAVWRMPVGAATGFTLAGGPVGEPALGPVAYMHRASSADNPTAPLSHHTFDSTHIAFGVITAAVDHGPWVVEASVFNGREPDQNRWDFDFGPLDSFSGRLWYRPNDEWEFQASSGHLVSPEELEPGQNVVRSTASASWTRKNGSSFSAVTAGFGRNDTDQGGRNSFFIEGARHLDVNTLYTRFEAVQVETALLQTDMVVQGPAANLKNTVLALTIGGVHDVLSVRGFEGGIGADVTFYGVPATLQPMYSMHPVSVHVFFRLRPPAGSMGRMWNMRMSQPMAGHGMDMRPDHKMP
jgi:hypothetical protein